ncbi:MAG TPA: hypothetical protein VFA64_19905 [Hyphomicrobiaceae bacterium]|nr:hypothetical protein [Hyphomicrobiaceae bacterium]
MKLTVTVAGLADLARLSSARLLAHLRAAIERDLQAGTTAPPAIGNRE